MRQWMLIISACALALTGHASADPAHARGELAALPPAEAEQMAKSDLSLLLKPELDFKAGLGVRGLKGASFVTPAYGTDFKGLCRRDRLLLHYTATSRGGQSEDRPLKPYGVETSAWFTDVGMTGERDDDPPIPAPACQALATTADVDWFPARDSLQAAEAVLLLRKVRDQLKAGQLISPLCDSKCKDVVLATKHIFRINDCATPDTEAKGAICYDIWMDSNISITIKARGSLSLPGDIESVLAGTLIIVD